MQEYAIEKLGVECVELKWGQGAKDIGGEVKIRDLKKAQMLHERGYIVLPNPTDPARHRGLRARQLQGVRAALPRRHGDGRVVRQAGRGAAQGRRQVRLPQDRRLSARRPGPRVEFCLEVQARPAHRRRRRRRHRHEPVADDERVGRAAGRAALASLSVRQAAGRQEPVPAGAGGRRRLHLRGPDLQGPGPRRSAS